MWLWANVCGYWWANISPKISAFDYYYILNPSPLNIYTHNTQTYHYISSPIRETLGESSQIETLPYIAIHEKKDFLHLENGFINHGVEASNYNNILLGLVISNNEHDDDDECALWSHHQRGPCTGGWLLYQELPKCREDCEEGNGGSIGGGCDGQRGACPARVP